MQTCIVLHALKNKRKGQLGENKRAAAADLMRINNSLHLLSLTHRITFFFLILSLIMHSSYQFGL